MARCNVFIVGLVLALAFNFIQCSSNEIESNIEVNVVPNLTEFLLKNPGVKLRPLIKEAKAAPPPYLQTTYRFGQRINGDHLLATTSNGQQYPNPQDVNTNLYYPQTGLGGVITYLQITVDQSTNLGQAYLVSGGIGQRQIAVYIEARQTLYFSYQAEIYGY